MAEAQRALQEIGFGSKNGQNLKIEKGASSQDTSVQVGHAVINENNNSNNIESDQSYSIRNSSRALTHNHQ